MRAISTCEYLDLSLVVPVLDLAQAVVVLARVEWNNLPEITLREYIAGEATKTSRQTEGRGRERERKRKGEYLFERGVAPSTASRTVRTADVIRNYVEHHIDLTRFSSRDRGRQRGCYIARMTCRHESFQVVAASNVRIDASKLKPSARQSGERIVPLTSWAQ
jgi:hypothetical protein